MRQFVLRRRFESLQALLGGGLAALLGAGGSLVVFGLLGAVGFGVSLVVGYSSTRPGTAMASRRELGDLTGKAAVKRARQLRPTLDARQPVTGGDLGLRLGRLPGLRGGHDVLASHEDVVLEICGPRPNKTSALVVPAVLSAPGPVITTSNKVDAYTLTVYGRTQLGRVFVLDPQGLARVTQDWWWNPLRAVTDMGSAAPPSPRSGLTTPSPRPSTASSPTHPGDSHDRQRGTTHPRAAARGDRPAAW